jgi:hypothetical protein
MPVQLVQQPEQRLAQDGEPAVVLHQFQPGGQGFELLLFLRAGKQHRLVALLAPGATSPSGTTMAME